MSEPATRGRPVGLLLNPDALRYVLGARSQAWLSKQAGVSVAHMSEIIKGHKGVTPEAGERIADALDVPLGVLFPEVVQFTTAVRHFTAPKVAA